MIKIEPPPPLQPPQSFATKEEKNIRALRKTFILFQLIIRLEVGKVGVGKKT